MSHVLVDPHSDDLGVASKSYSWILEAGVYRHSGPPSSGVGVKKINVSPYSPPAKLKAAAATAPKAFLDTPDRADSKNALGAVAGPGSGYELAVTSYTLVRARVPRGFRARGIFHKKSLYKVVTDSDPYPTNIPYKRGTCGTCTSSLW